MADDSLARNQPAATASVDADYDAIYATVVASERGRWFLDEYAQRHRGADTERVLIALARIEQAIHGGSPSEPADSMRGELVAMMEAIALARDDVVGRQGDPAARGEAALADFRHAVEQIRELIRTTHDDAASGPADQLSFQTNRLTVAGERLARSIGSLRILLGLLDELDEHLRHLVGEPRPVADTAAEPERPAADMTVDMSPEPGSSPAAEVSAGSLPAPEPPVAKPDSPPVNIHPDAPAPQPHSVQAAPSHEPFWDLTIGMPRSVRDPTTDGADPAHEIEWAFAPGVAAPEPVWNAGQSLPPLDIPVARQPEPPPISPTAALEHLEAREYGRQSLVTPDTPSETGALDDLVMGPAPAPDGHEDTASPEPDSQWIVEPAAAVPIAEPGLDDGLLNIGDTGETADTADTETPPVKPDDVSTAAADSAVEQVTAHDVSLSQETSQPEDSAVDTASMLERLESMRTAISELMNEVSEKPPRPTPPQS